MTRYECHGCWKIYDDEVGMPIRCCDKVIRHKIDGCECVCHVSSLRCDKCREEKCK